jgi:hypothetical protein
VLGLVSFFYIEGQYNLEIIKWYWHILAVSGIGMFDRFYLPTKTYASCCQNWIKTWKRERRRGEWWQTT